MNAVRPAFVRPARPARPALSVIVPVLQGAGYLGRSLAALAASDLPRDEWELIVVDDGSTDASPALAAAAADVVLVPANPAAGPGGPARARNRGAAVARGHLLAFVDADVCVHPDALRRLVAAFGDGPDAPDAVFGAYDTSPAAPGLVSQYRNLVHHAVHQAEAGEAASFWAGLGAVRAEWFARVGGFDAARYPRPSVEDVELGYRLRRAGARIRLRPEIQGTHLKRWTLRGGARTDVLDRGVPWVRLILARETPPNGLTLNVRPRERVLTPDERGEGADGVRSSADASDYGIWVAAEPLAGLKFYLTADHRLEIAHYPRVRGRTDHASDDVVGVFDVRDPVPDRLVHRILKRHRAARYRHDLGAEELHPHDVQLLAAGVVLAHVHHALLAVQGGDGRGRDPVLARAGLGDDALLAHPVGQQDLSEGVVDLVCPRVREVLALEPHVRPAPLAGESLGEHQGRRTSNEVLRQDVQFLDELWVVLVALIGLL